MLLLLDIIIIVTAGKLLNVLKRHSLLLFKCETFKVSRVIVVVNREHIIGIYNARVYRRYPYMRNDRVLSSLPFIFASKKKKTRALQRPENTLQEFYRMLILSYCVHTALIIPYSYLLIILIHLEYDHQSIRWYVNSRISSTAIVYILTYGEKKRTQRIHILSWLHIINYARMSVDGGGGAA